MKRMTPAVKLLLFVLKGKYKYFSERGMLAEDGSFYCVDRSLMEQLGIGDNTIRRARIYLKEAGEIDYVIGRHKGSATRYWVILKGAKMEPFGYNSKEAKISVKGASLIVKVSQDGTLYHKEVIMQNNINVPDVTSFTDEDRAGIRDYAKSYGVNETSDFLVRKGFDPELIKQILEGMNAQESCLKVEP